MYAIRSYYADWEGWAHHTEELGGHIQLVGDDLFVTNPAIVITSYSIHYTKLYEGLFPRPATRSPCPPCGRGVALPATLGSLEIVQPVVQPLARGGRHLADGDSYNFV